MEKKSFKVRAVFAQTKKKRTILQDAESIDEVIQILTSKGYLEPFEIEELEPDPPTEKQLNYARDLGIEIPQGATKDDLSALLDRKLSNDTDPNPELVIYAKLMGIEFHQYVGKKALYNKIFENLGLRDKLAFFCILRVSVFIRRS